ncbi:septation ring formation regulator EzrA [Fundicoccus culcitae]|uniref:Septation ring formation regulator EzrA n=1 Tax=Fundicoccus culcitae TaxID=2969821 RepID=A0ABY5P620_9LACT|nr:septation ring formation regulator EzrA [Fundicoccus culcitae]UUX34021.1 selenide, water dikinase [Fundicoccus culcitae]
MRFTDILFIIVVLVLVAYGVIYYVRTQRSRELRELEQRKDDMMSVSIADQLFTLKNMDLSGQTKRKYESIVASWQTITNFQFTEIESALVGAEQYSEQMNLVKAKKTMAQAREMMDETEVQVNDLHDMLTELLKVDTENYEKHEQLMERYNTARKSIMNHSFDYGPAIETLEKNLNYLELNFTKYNEYTKNGDHLEARDMLENIESDLTSLEEILEKIPAMYSQIKNQYEDSLEDLRDGYQKMLDSRFNFEDISIPEKIDEIQEQLNDAKNRIKQADLVEAKTLMDKAERNINSLYDLMETEIASRDFVNKNIVQLKTLLNEVAEHNRYASIEVDRIAQSYILHENEVETIGELTDQIEIEYNKYRQLTRDIEEHNAIYTNIESSIKKIRKRVEEIDESQNNILKGLSDLNHREKETKNNLDMYELELRNFKRKVEKNHLPGLHDNYYALFYKVTDQIENLSHQLNRVRINMVEIDQLESQLVENLADLDELTEETVDSAMLTEYMIQHSNRFRYDYPEVDQAIKEAQYLFYQEYRYEEALAVIEKALRRVEQDAPTQVRRMYHQEKQTRL